MAAGPLDGIKVYDFSQVIAGPYGGVLLADYGADVVCVEPPGGSAHRSTMKGTAHPNVSHNKRSIAINLKKDGVDPIVEQIAKDADVVMHNFTPGTMEKLGCGYETLKEYNEDLVYCAVTGFGEDGPYKDRRGYDPIVQAMSGLMSMTGEPDRKPSRVGASLIDAGVGAHLAFAVMAALWEREKGGSGRKIDISLFDVGATYMGYWFTYYTRYGEVPVRRGHSHDLNASQGLFNTEDGMIFIVFEDPTHWDRLCAALEKPGWHDDPRLNTTQARNENREYLHDTIDEAFSQYETDELMEKFLDADLPVAEYNTVPEVLDDPQLKHRGTIDPVEDIDGTEVAIGSRPIHFSGYAPELEAPPELAEDTETVLDELGFEADEVEQFVADGITPTDGFSPFGDE